MGTRHNVVVIFRFILFGMFFPKKFLVFGGYQNFQALRFFPPGIIITFYANKFTNIVFHQNMTNIACSIQPL